MKASLSTMREKKKFIIENMYVFIYLCLIINCQSLKDYTKYMNPIRWVKMSVQKIIDVTGTGKIWEVIITPKLEPNI